MRSRYGIHPFCAVLLASASLLFSACQQQPTTPSLYRSAYNSDSSAAFRVSLTLSKGPELQRAVQQQGFQLQNSQGGIPAKTVADVLAIRVFLVSSATPPGGSVSPYNAQVFSLLTPTGSQSVLFDNVPPGSYYACAAAFDSSVSFNAASNITAPSSSVNYAEGQAFCSNSGGEAGSPGRVSVSSSYQVTGSATLQVPVVLKGVVGANIDADVTVTNG